MTHRITWEADVDSDSGSVRVVYVGGSPLAARVAYSSTVQALIRQVGRYGGWAVYHEVDGREVKSWVAQAPWPVQGGVSWPKEQRETKEQRTAREAWEREVDWASERRANGGCLAS